MPKLQRTFVIADDLSGALDASVSFVRYGYKVRVALSPDSISSVIESDADVVAVNTGSREVSEVIARARLAAVLKEIPQGFKIIKKIDSRLKGNIRAETEELLACGFQKILVAPAIPKLGRIVTDGKLFGAGISNPLVVADIFTGLNAEVTIPDTVYDADLDTVVQSLAANTLVVGASGVSSAIARSEAQVICPFKTPKSERVLIVIGSRDPITLTQIDTLLNARSDIGYIACPNGYPPSTQPNTKITLVQLTQGSARQPSADVTSRFVLTVADIIEHSKPDAIIASGGETAQEVLAILGVRSLVLVGEARPGVPVSLADISGHELTLLTKSGGFGGRAILLELLSDIQK